MLQQWLRQSPGAARFLRGSCCRGPLSGSLRHSPLPTASHRCIGSLQTSTTESKERIPLRKQLKQDAKALKAQKRQRRESEEASRQKWELTVGIEIHAQLNTETKLFSSASRLCPYPHWPKMHNLICVEQEHPRRTPTPPTQMSRSLTWRFRAVSRFVFCNMHYWKLLICIGIPSDNVVTRPARRDCLELRHPASQSVRSKTLLLS
jgi:hypothetical protein